MRSEACNAPVPDPAIKNKWVNENLTIPDNPVSVIQ